MSDELSSPVFHIYCDESRQSEHRFMVLGGLVIRATNVPNFNTTMAKCRAETNMHAELKWTKVSPQKLPEYKRFIDYFFAVNNANQVRFHSLLIDNHQVDHKRFSGGDKELGFYKFYYQLLLHAFGWRYCQKETGSRLVVLLDHRNSSYSLDTLKRELNRGMARKFQVPGNPFVSVESRDSKQTDLIQIADLLIGAVGFQKNGLHLLAESKRAKVELAAYIAAQAGLDDLISDTQRSNYRFSIWNFRLQQKNSARVP